MPKRVLMTGWGRTQPVAAELLQFDPASQGNELPFSKGPMIMRGLGRSYGDAAQAAGGVTVVLADQIEASSIDADGRLTVGAGTSIDSILARYVPKGYFVPVTPGTRYVTIGGAIAADVHGKNHHVEGTFAAGVDSFELIAPAGAFHVTPDGDPELFWATAGGMGLTGIISSATIRMLPIETSYVSVETRRIGDLDELMTTMIGSDHDFRYSVAWIDCLAKGASMGRAVLTRGDHAPASALDSRRAADPLHYDAKVRLGAPRWVPKGALNLASVTAFNEVWYRKAPKLREGELIPLAGFFHPLDGVRDWNRIYGPAGFLQYQFVVPNGKEEALRRIIGRISAAKITSFLAVLKRFGAANPGILSFPQPGWTLALDIPIGSEHLGALLDELDQEVLEAGGRIYLAKDSRADAEAIAAMYPRLGELATVKRRLDPKGIIKSDLSRRLRLT